MGAKSGHRRNKLCLNQQQLSDFLAVHVAGTVALELQHTRMTEQQSLGRQNSKRNQLSLPKGLNIQSLQKRPSIAPVPAMLEANNIHIHITGSDTEEEDDDAASDDDFPE